MTYREAGVDIDAGDALVEKIKPFAKRTMRPEVLGGIGGFGALVEVSKKYKKPVMVSGTDGVGTKLKVAFRMKKHDTVGIDLVAMSVNDILVSGAEQIGSLRHVQRRHADARRGAPRADAHLREARARGPRGGEGEGHGAHHRRRPHREHPARAAGRHVRSAGFDELAGAEDLRLAQ